MRCIKAHGVYYVFFDTAILTNPSRKQALADALHYHFYGVYESPQTIVTDYA